MFGNVNVAVLRIINLSMFANHVVKLDILDHNTVMVFLILLWILWVGVVERLLMKPVMLTTLQSLRLERTPMFL